MTARGKVIHSCCCSRSRQSSSLHQTINLTRTSHGPFGKSLNKNTLFLIFSDLQTRSLDFQQVRNNLIVYLKVRSSDHESYFVVHLHLDELKDFLHTSWDNTALRVTTIIFETLHSVSLACTSLTICKYCRIIAF